MAAFKINFFKIVTHKIQINCTLLKVSFLGLVSFI
jgi:hypothetical protein